MQEAGFLEGLSQMFSPDFMPHGYCYLWNPWIVWLHVISDALITLSYYCIPFILIYFIRKNRDLPFNRVFWMFGVFILACGTTHLMEIWNIWHASYLVAGLVKGLTAAVSLVTAAMLIPLVPQAISLPTRMRDLQAEQSERRQAEEALRESQAQLAGIIGSAMDSIITVDEEQKIVLFNEAAEKMFLCPVAGAMGQPLTRFIPQRFHAGHAEHIRNFGDAGVTNRAMGPKGVLWALRGDGKEFQIEASISQAVSGGKKLFTVIIRDVTERQRAEASRSQLAAIIESTDSAILSKDLSGIITSWNNGAELLFGYRADEMLGKHVNVIVPVEQRAEELDFLLQVADGRVVHREEAVRRRKDGTLVPISLILSPMRDPGGKIVGASAISQGITDRKQAEAALREQARMLDLAQVMVRDMDSRIVFWGQGCEQLYGYSRDEAMGRSSHYLLNTVFPQPLDQVEEAIFRSGRWEGELVHHKKNGEPVAVASVWTLHRDPQGKPIRIIEANTDITERNLAREQMSAQAEELARSREDLQKQAQLLESVLNSMGEGLVATDERGNFVIWNPAAERIVGLGAAHVPREQWAEHYGVYLTDTVTPFPLERNPLNRAIQGEVSTAEMFVRNPALEEGVFIEASASPLRNKDGSVRGGVIAFRDITKSKAAEREIRQLNEELELRVAERTEQLEEANKELEAFTYSVSHDLRAPLRHIGGFSNLLVEEFKPQLPDEAQHYLQRIEEGARRMGQLVDEMLNLARVGRHAVTREKTNLNAMVAEVVAMLKADYQGREVEWRIAELPAVECDAVLTRQIFQNLLANAVKFTRPRPRAVIEVGQQIENGQAVFFVHDNGVGFSMKYVDKLFGTFQRLHRAEDFEGTGVGLATVKRIAQKHGGRAWAESEPDQGAKFYFTLGAGVSGPNVFASPKEATGANA